MKSKILLICALTLTFVGCSSKSKSNSAKTPAVTTGVAVDDYIAGATVCGDVDNNGILEQNEDNTLAGFVATGKDAPCTKTNTFGEYTFKVKVSSPLVLSGGKDIGTGLPFTGTFTAPVGSTVVTPLTTIVNSLVKSGTPVEEATKTVATSLGLEGINLTTFDAVNALGNGSGGNLAKDSNGAKVLAAQTKIQILLDVISKTVASASSEKGEKTVSVVAIAQLAKLIENKEEINATTIEVVINKTAKEVFKDDNNSQAKVAKVAKATSEVTVKVAKKAEASIQTGGADALKESNTFILAVSKNIINKTIEAVKNSDSSELEALDTEEITKGITPPVRIKIPVITGTGGGTN